MRTFAGQGAASVMALFTALACLAGSASAQSFTVEEPSSILIFPKVVNDEDRDTVIQITNNNNMMAYARCFYTDGQVRNGLPRWSVTDFEISLTRQQTTTWAASTGRPANPADDQTGLDPGFVPPLVPGFTGSLVCVQVDMPYEGAPSGGNDLTGRADVGGSDYNAYGLPAIGNPNNDRVLDLDGIEYAQCPSAYHLNFAANGPSGAIALGPMLGQGIDAVGTVSTSVTVVPCNFDFGNLIPPRVRVGFSPIVDEMENQVSEGTPAEVICWDNLQLSGSGFDDFPTSFGTTRMRGTQASGQGPVPAPFVAIANVLRVGGAGGMDSASTNLHAVADSLTTGRIILP
jgi:hypothetical protein